MGTGALIVLAIALGADAFSLCLALGISGVRKSQIVLITFVIFIFHIIMPLLGFFVGELAGKYIGEIASIIGAIILLYLGLKMIWDILKKEDEEPKIALLNTWGLLILALSVSMDALSVGFTLGTQNVNMLLTPLIFGFVAGTMTFLGLILGKFLNHAIGKKARLVGGIILIIIGIKLFF